MIDYKYIIEDLMTFFTEGEFSAEAQQAKKEFFELAGVFDEESDGFEQKMSQFIDWYLFTRKLSSHNLRPIDFVREKKPFSISDEDQGLYTNLFDIRHSLFEFLKIKGDDLHVKDLLSGYTLVIKDSYVKIGFDKGSLFEARIIPHGDTFSFTSSFCFHPPTAKKFIDKEIKRIKKVHESEQSAERLKFLTRLFKMKNKYDQYRHVEVKEIYSNDSKLRL